MAFLQQDDINLEHNQRDTLLRELRHNAKLGDEQRDTLLCKLRRRLAADLQAAGVAAGTADYVRSALKVQPLCRQPKKKAFLSF